MTDTKTHRLTMHNDNVHTFSYITACIIKFCKHDPLQAEQCVMIAHNTGQCDIKLGNYLDIVELQLNFDRTNIKTEVNNVN